MSKHIVADRKVLTTLNRAELHAALFLPSWEVVTTQAIVSQLSATTKRGWEAYIEQKQFTILDNEPHDVEIELRSKAQNLCYADRSLFGLALTIGGTVITGEAIIAKTLQHYRIPVQSLSWIKTVQKRTGNLKLEQERRFSNAIKKNSCWEAAKATV